MRGSQRRPVVLAILLTSLAWVVVGGAALVAWRRPVPVSFAIQPPPATATPIPTATPKPLVVEVVGAVREAGVYRLPDGSRVQDAITAAGGLSEDAEGSAVHKTRTLVDGERVSVPFRVDSEPAQASQDGPDRLENGRTGGMFPVPINTASVAELEALPGIGPKTAQAIVDYRNAHGPFVSVEAILEVKGIGDVTLERIRNLITLD
jgi:competence protein ComEA